MSLLYAGCLLFGGFSKSRSEADVIVVMVGIVLYALFLFGFHPYVLNVPVI